MDASNQQILARAVLRLLRPLVRILLRNGIAFGTFSDLANLEQVEKAWEEAYKETSKGDGVARKAAYMKMMKPGTHYDRLIRVSKKSE